MTPEAVYLAVVILTASVLFYTRWLRPDVTALLVMVSLMVPWRSTARGLVPILKPEEGFSGFGSAAIVMVAGMFVLSGALVRTGGAQLAGGSLLRRLSSSERALQVATLALATIFSAFINDTATVLIWMPIVIGICREKGYSVRRVLLLLAFGSLLGGQWTLIGTRSNIIVSDYLLSRTGTDIGFFVFTPIAATIFGVSLLFFLVAGQRFLPRASGARSLVERYDITQYVTELRVMPKSKLVGTSIGEFRLDKDHGISVWGVIREGEDRIPASTYLKIRAEDILIVEGRVAAITKLLHEAGLQLVQELQVAETTLKNVDLHMVEALVTAGSVLRGRCLKDLEFQLRFNFTVLAMGCHGRPLSGRLLSHRIEEGDSLLLVGRQEDIDDLRKEEGFLLLESRPLPPTGKSKAFCGLGLLAFVAASSASGVFSPVLAIPIAAVLSVLTRCISVRDAYASLDLPALVLIGGMIPFGLALEKTGTARALAESIALVLQPLGVLWTFSFLLLFTVLFTQLIENAAVAVVLAPIAFDLANAVGAKPLPFLLGLAICTSTAFMTPFAHESTMLVMGPGRYHFRDYLKLGAPFAILSWIGTALLVPVLHPFH